MALLPRSWADHTSLVYVRIGGLRRVEQTQPIHSDLELVHTAPVALPLEVAGVALRPEQLPGDGLVDGRSVGGCELGQRLDHGLHGCLWG